MNAPPPPRFAGWARLPRGRWRCLVRECPTEDEAMAQLRRQTARERFVDLCVLPSGKTPDRK